jgi:hypothetical protein
MPMTDHQIRALAFLAKDCRPLGSRRWDENGIYANIAKVRDRALPEVVLAVIRAACDRDAASPGVIPTAGSHWSDTRIEIPRPPVLRPTRDQRCSICSETQTRCRELWVGDHDFESDAMAAQRKAALDPDVVHETVVAIRPEHTQTTTIEPSTTPPADPRCSDSNGTCIRAHGHTGPHQGPPPNPETECSPASTAAPQPTA